MRNIDEDNEFRIRRIYQSEDDASNASEDDISTTIFESGDKTSSLAVALHITKDAFTFNDLAKLESLRSKVPLDLSRPTCPRRFITEKETKNDAEQQYQEDGWIRILLNKTIQERWNLPFQCLPWYRFLEYTSEGGCMAKHSDGTNTYKGMQSVATMLLYLSTCDSGGETTLYKKKKKKTKREKKNRNLQLPCNGLNHDDGSGNILESIRPVYNTVLIFPHGWQHSGDNVEAKHPKIVLRVDLARL